MKRIIAVILMALLLAGCVPVGLQETTVPLADPMDAETVFETMFEAENRIGMELHFADGSSYGPYYAYSLPKELKLKNESLTEIEVPDVSGSPWRLTVGAGDGAVALTVYGGSQEILCYREGNACRYYRAAVGTEQALREVFDVLQWRAHDRISFFSGKSGRAIITTYGETALPSFLYEMAPGSIWHIEDYDCRSVSLTEKKGKVLHGKIVFAVKPSRKDMEMIPELGAFYKKEDGWQVYEKDVYIEHQSDGKWYELAEADYNRAYAEGFTPFDPAKTEAKETAKDFLKALPEKLEALQSAKNEAELVKLAELFLQTTTAVPFSGRIDFDWNQFMTEGAQQNTGIRALLRTYVNREGAAGYFNGFLGGILRPHTVIMEKETARVATEGLQIWFLKYGGKWLICDVSAGI